MNGDDRGKLAFWTQGNIQYDESEPYRCFIANECASQDYCCAEMVYSPTIQSTVVLKATVHETYVGAFVGMNRSPVARLLGIAKKKKIA
jgi:hypothetical protein